MRIGVVGAGTMGSGIAQLAAAGGAETLVFDVAGAERGVAAAQDGLERWRAKGRLDGEPGPLRAVAGLEDLAGCELVIEAIAEDLAAKQALFAQLPEGAVLASNTSSIPITAIAAAAPDPSRVVGMHFFNPAPVMRLMELVRAVQSSDEAIAFARAVGEGMGREVVEVADVPGFLVNRCNRPFGLEALKLRQERVATVEEIDAIVRAAGFRMGPFELQDLVGVDVGLAVARSFHELGFGEPRWRPSPLSAQLVAAGHLGRKTGRGWYRYPDDGTPHRPEDPPLPRPGGGDGRLVVVAGDLAVAHWLRDLADDAGWAVADEAEGDVPFLCVDAGAEAGAGPPLQGAPQALLCAEGSLHQLDPGGGAVGFHAFPGSGTAELTRGPHTTGAAADRAVELFTSLGLRTAWVGDAPGLVLGRIVAQLVNECAFALGEGVVEDAADVDIALQLGLNHPRGPLAWADVIGLDHLLGVLDGLRAERGEERYRAAPLLRALVAEGRVGELVGAGFHVNDDEPSHDLEL